MLPNVPYANARVRDQSTTVYSRGLVRALPDSRQPLLHRRSQPFRQLAAQLEEPARELPPDRRVGPAIGEQALAREPRVEVDDAVRASRRRDRTRRGRPRPGRARRAASRSRGRGCGRPRRRRSPGRRRSQSSQQRWWTWSAAMKTTKRSSGSKRSASQSAISTFCSRRAAHEVEVDAAVRADREAVIEDERAERLLQLAHELARVGQPAPRARRRRSRRWRSPRPPVRAT